MKRCLEIIKKYGKITISILGKEFGTVFGVLGGVAIFYDFTIFKLTIRLVISSIILIILIIIGILKTKNMVKKNSCNVYQSGKTKIIFEYGDINQVIKDADKKQELITVVVPINTSLDITFNREIIIKDTIHRQCLDYIYEKMNMEISEDYINSIKIKKEKFNNNGKLGDWFLLTPSELKIESYVQFLFVEMFKLEKKNGKEINKKPKKEQYIVGVQSLLSAIPEILCQKSKVYIPLIGAGEGNVGKSNDIMHFMNSMLRFNKDILRQEIHVILNQKFKTENDIYDLIKY